jgi:hypothetical protein
MAHRTARLTEFGRLLLVVQGHAGREPAGLGLRAHPGCPRPRDGIGAVGHLELGTKSTTGSGSLSRLPATSHSIQTWEAAVAAVIAHAHRSAVRRLLMPPSPPLPGRMGMQLAGRGPTGLHHDADSGQPQHERQQWQHTEQEGDR